MEMAIVWFPGMRGDSITKRIRPACFTMSAPMPEKCLAAARLDSKSSPLLAVTAALS